MTKLTKSDNGESLSRVLAKQFLQSVVLRRETALGGDIHNQHRLALELGEGEIAHLRVFTNEGVEGRELGCLNNITFKFRFRQHFKKKKLVFQN